MKTLTEIQKSNLNKILEGMRSLPAGYENLDMSTFEDGDDETLDTSIGKKGNISNGCETCACIVGHGPTFGVPMIPSDFTRLGDWENYSERVFGLPVGNGRWKFLFSDKWSDSIDECIARLEIFIEGRFEKECATLDETSYTYDEIDYSHLYAI